ncbi:MAG: ABC transporter ATP-binding protein [Alphaproteobacteria bacterium]|nr:ABC transporter ATP-binding protein [Alphaproteobacteria bacterium]
MTKGHALGGVRLNNVTVAFDGHPALHHISGRFQPGTLTAVVGPNGAGKSTLLRAIVGDLTPSSGTVTTDSDRIAYLPQASRLNHDLPITVADAVLMGRWRRLGLHQAARQEDLADASAALAEVGLGGFERRAVSSLSVGQRQRALFARLMLTDADTVLLDEPFAAIDQRTTSDLLRVVQQWHASRRTVIAVLHDLDQVRSAFPLTLLVARTVVEWGATETVLTAANLARARSMSEASDTHADWCRDAA